MNIHRVQPELAANCYQHAADCLRLGYMTGATLRRLMRYHSVTIREAARRMDIPMTLVRERRRNGLPTREHVMDWIEALHQ